MSDAIIAIDEKGGGHLIKMLTDDQGLIELEPEIELSELEFAEKPGLYFADISFRFCGSVRCVGRGNCPGDCCEADWEITKPLFAIDAEGCDL
jgi:hypothetical protein